mgnify:CR=1 FL=1
MFKVTLSIEQKWWNHSLEELTGFFISRLQKKKGETEIER